MSVVTGGSNSPSALKTISRLVSLATAGSSAMNKRVVAGVLAFIANGRGVSLTVVLLVTLHESTKNSFGRCASLARSDSSARSGYSAVL